MSLYLLDLNSIETPFKYIENPWIQLLLFAPIFEELVFRSSIQERLKKDIRSKSVIPLISAILFSVSHAIALWFLHEKFYSFVYVQIGYTFFLGWILAKAQDRGAKTIEPILLHFIFNLFFVPW
jgi:membrane protease YdiL (CAAX protease family)